ncbi:phospholipase D family protein [Marinobacterium marinum]|uniref:Phospholipase D family protein n=1 Tax=Marinobacterium marinum TaxID=2756129 RepID=A0A7W1WYG0_9GAMM|nr:phospholipase D family protein [Marinobacterium marinum]MBA4502540.1 phospholipase D family protein [Marinobacterium marinum]
MSNYWGAVVGSLGLLLGGCAGLPENTGRLESYQLADTEDTRLGRVSAAGLAADVSGFQLLDSGIDAFVARVALAREAEQSIDAQYYLLHDDMTGHLFLDELVKAAERGVRVRLLVDDMGLEGRDESVAALAALTNFEVRIFNPFGRHLGRLSQFITRFGSVTRRMHNKLFIVDGQAVVLGGRNIGNEYFEADPALAFGDLDVVGFGPIATDAARSFDAYWNHDLAYPVARLVDSPLDALAARRFRHYSSEYIEQHAHDYAYYFDALRNSWLTQQLNAGSLSLVWGQARLVSDDPDKLVTDRRQTELHLSRELEPYFLELEKSLLIFSPYFVPGREGVEFLEALVERGVRVRVLTNSLASTDVPVVHVGYARYRRELLRAGVELYEMNRQVRAPAKREGWNFTGSSKASLHAKSFVLDGEKVFIGSLNMDPRSLVENSEVGVVLEVPEIAQEMLEWFEHDIDRVAFRVSLEQGSFGSERLRWDGWSGDQPVVFDVEPYTSVWQRLGVGLLRVLPIDSQL